MAKHTDRPATVTTFRKFVEVRPCEQTDKQTDMPITVLYTIADIQMNFYASGHLKLYA